MPPCCDVVGRAGIAPNSDVVSRAVTHLLAACQRALCLSRRRHALLAAACERCAASASRALARASSTSCAADARALPPLPAPSPKAAAVRAFDAMGCAEAGAGSEATA